MAKAKNNILTVICSPKNFDFFKKQQKKLRKTLLDSFDIPKNSDMELISDPEISDDDDHLYLFVNNQKFGKILIVNEEPKDRGLH